MNLVLLESHGGMFKWKIFYENEELKLKKMKI